MIEKQISDVLNQIQLEGTPVSAERYGCGHINVTWLVETDSDVKYILQKMSTAMCKDSAGLMRNIYLVTEHLKKKTTDPRAVMTIIPTKDGNIYYADDNGNWRVYVFVPDTLCLQTVESDEDFYQSALAFGKFGDDLKDFPSEELLEVIPNFHNTPNRYRIFHEKLDADVMGRAAQVQKEIEFFLAHEEEMGTLQKMREDGTLPVKVTHNDTKLNNVLLDQTTRTALCVIDMDTVMPGLSAYDYGDSIRFGAATAAEDEKDLDKVWMDLHKYQVYTEGFLKASPGLTEKEIEMLPMGAKTMTLE